MFCLEAIYPVCDEDKKTLLAYKGLEDPDTMYMHKAMKDLDKN